MPLLKNPKHERFAQEVAKGKSANQAYAIAGFKKSTTNAARLNANEPIRMRIEELLAKSAQKAGVTIDKIVQELAKIGFSDIRKALDWGMVNTEKGPQQFVTLKDSAEVDDATAATVSEVWQTNQGIRFKFHDKPAALRDLGRHLGMFKIDNQQQANGPQTLTIVIKDTD